MIDALKPCLFCGSESVSVLNGADTVAYCYNCGCNGPIARWRRGETPSDRRARAIALWNAAPRPQQPTAETLEQCRLLQRESADAYEYARCLVFEPRMQARAQRAAAAISAAERRLRGVE